MGHTCVRASAEAGSEAVPADGKLVCEERASKAIRVCETKEGQFDSLLSEDAVQPILPTVKVRSGFLTCSRRKSSANCHILSSARTAMLLHWS
ncbi:MAG: hypothetical protein P4M11_03125 [Candidatus Pacebacteria bacterium]|nr:hypothetical protein [Candidatus Paceibacterota bacterium]